MEKVRNHTDQFLRSLPFFSGLSEIDMGIFQDASKIRDYSKGKHLFRQGDRAERFFVILQGWVKLYRGTAEGEEAIVALFTRGDVFGEAVLLDNPVYSFSAEAAEDARLVEIPAEALKDRAKASPDIISRIMASMSQQINKLQRENERRDLMDAPQRVGYLLLQLSSGIIGKGGTFLFPYDKLLAARQLGMKPETFSRALARLKTVGVTARGAEITIESFASLSGYCCGDCTARERKG
jgi:CRP-like cAMP-binding protein